MPNLFIFILGSTISSVCVNCVRSCQKILIIKLIDILDISGKLDKKMLDICTCIYVTGQPSNGIHVRICGKMGRVSMTLLKLIRLAWMKRNYTSIKIRIKRFVNITLVRKDINSDNFKEILNKTVSYIRLSGHVVV